MRVVSSGVFPLTRFRETWRSSFVCSHPHALFLAFRFSLSHPEGNGVEWNGNKREHAGEPAARCFVVEYNSGALERVNADRYSVRNGWKCIEKRPPSPQEFSNDQMRTARGSSAVFFFFPFSFIRHSNLPPRCFWTNESYLNIERGSVGFIEFRFPLWGSLTLCCSSPPAAISSPSIKYDRGGFEIKEMARHLKKRRRRKRISKKKLRRKS